MTLVIKFGGTSVGTADAMHRTTELILKCRQQWGKVIVIASALGTKPVKVTDLLLNGAKTALAGDSQTYLHLADQLRLAHHQIVDQLLQAPEHATVMAEIDQFIDRFLALCQAVWVLGELTPRALDAISGMGEQMSVPILAAYLRQLGYSSQAISATELIRTDDNFQSATPDIDETRQLTQARLLPLLEAGGIPVVTGFIGSTEKGVITTLGRGGSDFSAAILGQAIEAEEVWIWTDVDGVMTTDPRLVPTAHTIPQLTNREISELAYYGAKVLHPKTIRPCVENGIPLRIKNSFNPDCAGTLIVPDATEVNGQMKAVTAIPDLALITVEGKGMLGVPGIAARTFGAVARTQANVLLITQSSSEQSICFIVPASSAAKVIASLQTEFADELHRRDIDRIWGQQPVGIVTMVGAGMRGTPGIAGKIFSTLGHAQINVIAIAQGSSECSVSLVVDAPDIAPAIQHLHTLLQE